MANDNKAHGNLYQKALSRRAILGMSGSALATGLAGCTSGGGGGSGGQQTTETTTSTTGETSTTTASGSKQELMDKYDLELVDYADQVEDELTILQWNAYWPTDIVPNFEKLYDIDVSVSIFSSNEAMFNKLKSLGPGQVDIIFPSDFMVNIMATQGMLRTLNKDKIPNYGNLKDKFESVDYEPGDAPGTYSMPYNWGWSAMGNNTDVTGGPLEPTWDEMFNEEYDGQITMLNNMRETIGVALLKLGYSINTTDEAKINEAKELLIQQKENGLVKAYDSTNVESLLTNKEVSPAHGWNGQVFGAYRNLMNDNHEAPVEFVIPEEGNVIWTDAAVLDKEAPHPNAAHAFLNYINNVKVHAEITSWLIYPTILENEKEHRTDKWAFEKLEGFSPTEEQLGRMEYIENVGQATKHFSEAWTEVKNA
ncbi:PotD/PotF family extracellular solute-binding protein [Halobacteriaceae archaeon GCM10025711]